MHVQIVCKHAVEEKKIEQTIYFGEWRCICLLLLFTLLKVQSIAGLMGDENVYISIVNLTNGSAFDVRSNIIADINLTQLKCNTNEAWLRLTHSILNSSADLFYEKNQQRRTGLISIWRTQFKTQQIFNLHIIIHLINDFFD